MLEAIQHIALDAQRAPLLIWFFSERTKQAQPKPEHRATDGHHLLRY